MATVRVRRKLRNYTQLENGLVDDPKLSYKALGLLVFMLRQPDDWEFTLDWLARQHRDGLSAVRSTMNELEAAGYVVRGDQQRAGGGKFSGADYIVCEDPRDTACENRTPSACENRTPSACENQTPTACDFPTSENRTQPKTNLPSNNIPPYSPPKGGRRDRVHKDAPDWEPERFARLWAWYPHDKRGNKQRAIRAWEALHPDKALIDGIARALEIQSRTDEWERGVGIPHLSTYLNGYGWEGWDDPAQPRREARPAGRSDLEWI
ncbi:MAG: hypothetical protein IKQ10_03910 [Oscillospiraceae bacterium]|nr:hypothetical protein [Oscillospiraceae bacterium]